MKKKYEKTVNDSVLMLLRQQDWPYLIKDLTLYAYSRFKFWNLLKKKALKGFSPQEIAMEAIKMVLTGERQWDPTKSELLPFLKFHVVKGLTANLARSKETNLLTDISDLGKLLIPDDVDIEEDLQAKQVLDMIRKKLNGDNLLIGILNGLNDGLKRKEICEMLEINLKSYDNAIRRLRTRILEMDLERETLTIK